MPVLTDLLMKCMWAQSVFLFTTLFGLLLFLIQRASCCWLAWQSGGGLCKLNGEGRVERKELPGEVPSWKLWTLVDFCPSQWTISGSTFLGAVQDIQPVLGTVWLQGHLLPESLGSLLLPVLWMSLGWWPGLGTDQLQHKAGSTCVSHATSGWWKRYHATTIKQLCRDAEYYSHTCLLLVISCSKLTLAVSVFCRVPALYSQMNRAVCINIPLHILLYAKTYLMLLDGTCTAAKVLAQCNLEIQGSSAWWWSGFRRF